MLLFADLHLDIHVTQALLSLLSGVVVLLKCRCLGFRAEGFVEKFSGGQSIGAPGVKNEFRLPFAERSAKRLPLIPTPGVSSA